MKKVPMTVLRVLPLRSMPTVRECPEPTITEPVWNKGLSVACDLMQALLQAQCDAVISVNPHLDDFVKIVRALVLQTHVQTKAVAAPLTPIIEWLAINLPDKDVGLLKETESLQLNDDDFDTAGFYAVMLMMAAASEIADLINARKDNVNDTAAAVITKVRQFTENVDPQLNGMFTQKEERTRILASMLKAAMKVIFQYLPGTRMPPSLAHQMLACSLMVSHPDTIVSQDQLDAALGGFLDSRIKRK